MQVFTNVFIYRITRGFMKNKNFWKGVRRVLPVIGIAIFVYILIKINVVEVWKVVKEVDIYWLGIAAVFLLIYLIVQTVKWYLIAIGQKIKIPFKSALRINMITFLYGFVTPSRVGSILRADYLKKYSNLGKGISNFVIDKVLDVGALLLMAIALGFVFEDKLNFSFSYFILIFFILIACFLFFIKKERSRLVLRIFFKKLVPKKYKKSARITFDSFYEDMPSKLFLLGVFALTVFTWILNYTMVYFIALSLGINLNLIYFLAIMPLATLVAQIPITISGLGTREAAMISLFGLFGVSAVKVFSMSLIGLILGGVFPSIIAIFLILKNRK